MTKTAPVRLGSLHDDLNALAGKIYSELCNGDRAIWADDTAVVYATAPDDAATIPASWMAGTFSLGHPVSEIEPDLRALLRERARDGIVD